MDIKNAISKYIDGCRADMVSDLRSLIRIPSVMTEAVHNMPFGKETAKALSAALDLCRNAGLTIKNHENYIGTADLFEDKEPYLGILCHMDVVPVGDGWSVPPFELTERDGKLIGRGAIDDKGPAIAALYAIKAVRELKLPVKKNVRLILGTNEENGSADLAYYKNKEKLPSLLFTPDGSYPVINIEKGMLRVTLSARLAEHNDKADGLRLLMLKAGNAVNAVPEHAEAVLSGVDEKAVSAAVNCLKLPVSVNADSCEDGITITVKGKSVHASTPQQGENALTALLTIISALDTNNRYPEITAFTKLFPYGETDGLSCGIKCSDDISGELTTVLSVGECDGSTILCRQDIRFPVCESCAGIITRLEKAANKYGLTINADMKSEPHHVPKDSSFIKELLSVYEDVTGEKGYTVAIGGGTYVHETDNGVAFGAEFPDDKNNMHGADEFITTESLLLNAKIYANAIYRLCGEDN